MSNNFIKKYIIITLMLLVAGALSLYYFLPGRAKFSYPVTEKANALDVNSLPSTPANELIRYGSELVLHTSNYLGPGGSVAAISNGMNCGNCHLEAGTRINANWYKLVASTYPKFRARSGLVESVPFRINDCIQRSLNGTPLKQDSREMRALVAYITWVGNDQLMKPAANGKIIPELYLMNRAASPTAGAKVYSLNCVSCHGHDGNGREKPGDPGAFYPALWGDHSFNTGAGMFRLSMMAAFVYYNMPYNEKQQAPRLSADESWDVAAFILSKNRPFRVFKDWPDVSKKPFDYPYGPYADDFSETQHKYGPFNAIKKITVNK